MNISLPVVEYYQSKFQYYEVMFVNNIFKINNFTLVTKTLLCKLLMSPEQKETHLSKSNMIIYCRLEEMQVVEVKRSE